MIRKSIVFWGRVQGVGFRYRAEKAADLLGLTGWVANNWDGSVILEVQGREEEIDRLVSILQSDRYIQIFGMDAKTIPVLEEERRFRVRGY